MTRPMFDDNIAKPREWWQFVALVVLAFAVERHAEVAPPRATFAAKLPPPKGRRRRDIRPPRAC